MQRTTGDYYALLQVAKNATAEQIKKSFRSLALRFHPDKNPGDIEAEEKFKEISKAYEVLSDPDKKAFYDMTGTDGFNEMQGGMHAGGGRGCGKRGGCRGRGRSAGYWNRGSSSYNIRIHEIIISRDEAEKGAEISLKRQDMPDDSGFRIKLPANLQSGAVLQCINGGNETFLLRVKVSD